MYSCCSVRGLGIRMKKLHLVEEGGTEGENRMLIGVKKVLCYALLTLVLLGVGLHLWVLFLVRTGMNRGDISKLTADIKTECSTQYETKRHNFTRVIHHIWNSDDIPEQFVQARQSCRKLNPQYDYKLWKPNERRQFIADHYPWFLHMYDNYSQEIMRINAARYFIVYHYGGMYLDIDMECKVPFDAMLKQAFSEAPDTGVLLGATIPTGVGTAWIFGRKGHPFMEMVTKRLLTEYRWYVLPYWTNTISTGVIYMWRTYLNYPCQDQVYLVEPDIQYNVYFNHLHFSSWHKWDAPIMLFFDFLIKHCTSYLHLVFFMLSLAILVVLSRKCLKGLRNRRQLTLSGR